MKIKSLEGAARAVVPCPIYREGRVIKLQVHALPLNFRPRVESAIPYPPPPEEFARDENGRLLRDANDKPFTVARRNDPAWRAARDRCDTLHALVFVHEALRHDPQIEFETERQSPHGDRAFAEAVEKELEEIGFSDAEIMRIAQSAAAAEVASPAVIEEARERFLSETRRSADSVSPPEPDEAKTS